MPDVGVGDDALEIFLLDVVAVNLSVAVVEGDEDDVVEICRLDLYTVRVGLLAVYLECCRIYLSVRMVFCLATGDYTIFFKRFMLVDDRALLGLVRF